MWYHSVLHPMWKCSNPPFIALWPRLQVAAAHGPDLGDANAPDPHDLTGKGTDQWCGSKDKVRYTTIQWTTIMTIYQKIWKTTIKRVSILFPSLLGPFTPHYPTMGSNPDLMRKNGVQNYHHSSFVGGSQLFLIVYVVCIYILYTYLLMWLMCLFIDLLIYLSLTGCQMFPGIPPCFWPSWGSWSHNLDVVNW